MSMRPSPLPAFLLLRKNFSKPAFAPWELGRWMCTEHRDSEMKTNQYINGVEGIYIILSQVCFMAHGQRSKIPQLMDAPGNEVQHIHIEFRGVCVGGSPVPNYNSVTICMQG